jgi:hypothetical protein
VEHSIKEATQKLKMLQMVELVAPLEEESSLQRELHDFLEQEDIKWKQRANKEWLKYGDKNTKFFHACANQRNRRSQIVKVTDKHGRLCTTQGDIEEAFVQYFKELFTTGDALEVDNSLVAIERRVTPQMNTKLLATFTVEEISQALN